MNINENEKSLFHILDSCHTIFLFVATDLWLLLDLGLFGTHNPLNPVPRFCSQRDQVFSERLRKYCGTFLKSTNKKNIHKWLWQLCSTWCETVFAYLNGFHQWLFQSISKHYFDSQNMTWTNKREQDKSISGSTTKNGDPFMRLFVIFSCECRIY